MRSATIAAGLAVIWVLLWGSASPANILGGLAAGAALDPRRARSAPAWSGATGNACRPVAIARLVGHVLRTIIESNVVLTREIVTRGMNINTAVVGVPLPGCSDELLTLISNLVALAPGTMPLELTPARSCCTSTCSTSATSSRSAATSSTSPI